MEKKKRKKKKGERKKEKAERGGKRVCLSFKALFLTFGRS